MTKSRQSGEKEITEMRNRHIRKFSGTALSLAPEGCAAVVKNIAGGRMATAKLADMGIIPGTAIQVSCNRGGPVIVMVKGSRLCLGKGMADKVKVDLGAAAKKSPMERGGKNPSV